MNHVYAVIFDIDGTLLLSNDAHALAFLEAAATLGIKAEFAKVRRLIGKGGDKLLPEAFGLEQDSTQGKELAELKRDIFKTRYLPELQPAPGSRPLLSRLHDDGFRLGVATSGSKADVGALLERAGVQDLIRDIATADDVDASKPDPDVVHAALRKLDCPVNRVIMVGDTPYDVEAAQHAGARIIAVRCGGWSDDQLQGAVAIYDHPADLFTHYDQIFGAASLERAAMSKEYLSTYLNDHLAGSYLAVEILDHLAAETPSLSSSLSALKAEIEEDREQLKTLMAKQHIEESRVRKAGGWIADGLTEFKLAVDDDEKGRLRRLERLEALAIGIDGKIALWRALDAAARANTELGGMDYEGLIKRGQDQRARVETLRLQAAREALAA
jgi:HAD superfamily hydrolase (TIGR01509 family)